MKRKNNLIELIKKYKEIIMYLIFGVATTGVNWIIYIVLVNIIKADMTLANAIAWVGAVAFAYVTNKIYVFESHTTGVMETIREIIAFFGARVLSGIVEIVGPSLLFSLGMNQSILGVRGFAAKIVVSVVVVIMNYVLSKLLVFRKGKSDEKA